MRHEAPDRLVPNVDANSFVNVQALDNGGAVVNEAQGVVVNSKGLVASNLSQLAGASAVQITSRDGRTYRTSRVWRDEDKNLAVMKIDNDSLPSVPMADISEISIGQRVFLVTDRAGGKKTSRNRSSAISNRYRADVKAARYSTSSLQLSPPMLHGAR